MAPVNDDSFSLSSSAFTENGTIPSIYTCDSDNRNGISPPLKWENAPKETVSFVIIMDDPDAPKETFAHWLMWNIPPDTRNIPENDRGSCHQHMKLLIAMDFGCMDGHAG